jgi:hypothetical protein
LWQPARFTSRLGCITSESKDNDATNNAVLGFESPSTNSVCIALQLLGYG